VAKRGRPSKFQPAFSKQAYKLCLLGATNEKLADFFGVAVSTIDKWLAENSEFSGAVKKGRDVADAQVAESLHNRALGYSHRAVKIFVHLGRPIKVPYVEHYPPDTAAAFIWLKNRQPSKWRDHPLGEVGDNRLDEVLDLMKNGPADTNSENQKA